MHFIADMLLGKEPKFVGAPRWASDPSAFLYHIRVKFSDTDELVYTGMFVMLG